MSASQFCTFLVDGLYFGVEVERVQEVLRFQEIQEAGAKIVIAADRMAADQPDLLAAIEIGLGERYARHTDHERGRKHPA